MKKYSNVDEFIAGQTKWQKELLLLREILSETELEETVKWGSPTYTIDGKNVIGILGFNDYFCIWFYNGVFLKDEENKLINAQKGVTKALRQWRFKNKSEIDRRLIKTYLDEAISNQKTGKEFKPEKKKVEMPVLLDEALRKNEKALISFMAMTPFKQNEFKEFIASAKQEKTRLNRILKVIPLIENGIGLNDKYRK